MDLVGHRLWSPAEPSQRMARVDPGWRPNWWQGIFSVKGKLCLPLNPSRDTSSGTTHPHTHRSDCGRPDCSDSRRPELAFRPAFF